MSGKNVPSQLVADPQRPLQINSTARLPGPGRGSGDSFAGSNHFKPAVGRVAFGDNSQADSSARDRRADIHCGSVEMRSNRDVQVAALLDAPHLANVTDNPGKHGSVLVPGLETFQQIGAKLQCAGADKTGCLIKTECCERIDRSMTRGAKRQRRTKNLEPIGEFAIEKTRMNARTTLDEKPGYAARCQFVENRPDIWPAPHVTLHLDDFDAGFRECGPPFGDGEQQCGYFARRAREL